MSVPKLTYNISYPEETSQNSLESFSSIIERLEAMILYPRKPLQILKIQTQPKDVSSSLDPINWARGVNSYDVEEYDIL